MPRVVIPKVSAADSTSLVRFALYSWYWGSLGRKVPPVAKALGLSLTAADDWLQRSSFHTEDERRQLRLVEDALATDCISRLWRTIAAPFDQKFILRADPQWWPDLRRQDRFRCAVDVLVAADAAIENLKGTTPTALRTADVVAVERVATGLARVQAGPYGFTSEAFLRLVLLLPYAVDAVADFCLGTPVGFRVLRTFDRGLRTFPDSDSIATAASTLVDHYFDLPSSLRSVNQLRLARRVAWRSGRGAGVQSIAGSLSHFALDRERDLLQRRCAAWYLAELSGRAPVTDKWDTTRRALANEKPPMVDLAHLDTQKVRELAEYTRGISPFNDVDFMALPDALPTTGDGEALLDEILGTPQKPRQLRSLAAALRPGTVSLLRDALRTPCPIRWRTIIETLHACSPAVQSSAIGSLADVATLAFDGSQRRNIDHVVQRALLLLANLKGDERSLRTLVRLAQSRSATSAQKATAVWGIGDILLADPGLPRDRAMEAVGQALRDPTPTVRQAAMHSVASTRDTRLIPAIEEATSLGPANGPNDAETARWAVWAVGLMRSDSL